MDIRSFLNKKKEMKIVDLSYIHRNKINKCFCTSPFKPGINAIPTSTINYIPKDCVIIEIYQMSLNINY